MIAPDSTSYPYLAIAQWFDIDYGTVLQFVDSLGYPDLIIRRWWPTWAVAAADAWARETARQKRAHQA